MYAVMAEFRLIVR